MLLGATKFAVSLLLELGVIVPQETCQLTIGTFAWNCCVWPNAVLVVDGDKDTGVIVSTA
jgi:hypothetical protein